MNVDEIYAAMEWLFNDDITVTAPVEKQTNNNIIRDK